MKTIQITIEDGLLDKVDRTTQRLHMSRSAAIREALAQWLHERHMEELDRLDEEGYRRQPIQPEEFLIASDKRPQVEDWPWEDA
jgi:predicted transcriptional regulator